MNQNQNQIDIDDDYGLAEIHRQRMPTPQPSTQDDRLLPQKSVQSNHISVNSVLRSDNIVASFGSSPYNTFVIPRQTQKEKKVKSQVYDLNETKKKQWDLLSSKQGGELEEEDVITQQAQQKLKNERFYRFLYALIGIMTCHVRVQEKCALQKLRKKKSKKQQCTHLFQILQKIQFNRLRAAFIHLGFNSMQHSQVRAIDDMLEKKNFNRVKSLENENEDHGFSEHEKQIPLFDAESYQPYRKVQSDVAPYSLSNGKNEIFKFNPKIQKKSSEKRSFQESSGVENKSKEEAKTHIQVHLPSIEYARSMINSVDNNRRAGWLRLNCHQPPIVQSKSDFERYEASQKIYHLNPDTFKDSSPDFYQPHIQDIDSSQKTNTSLEFELAKKLAERQTETHLFEFDDLPPNHFTNGLPPVHSSIQQISTQKQTAQLPQAAQPQPLIAQPLANQLPLAAQQVLATQPTIEQQKTQQQKNSFANPVIKQVTSMIGSSSKIVKAERNVKSELNQEQNEDWTLEQTPMKQHQTPKKKQQVSKKRQEDVKQLNGQIQPRWSLKNNEYFAQGLVDMQINPQNARRSLDFQPSAEHKQRPKSVTIHYLSPEKGSPQLTKAAENLNPDSHSRFHSNPAEKQNIRFIYTNQGNNQGMARNQSQPNLQILRKQLILVEKNELLGYQNHHPYIVEQTVQFQGKQNRVYSFGQNQNASQMGRPSSKTSIPAQGRFVEMVAIRHHSPNKMRQVQADQIVVEDSRKRNSKLPINYEDRSSNNFIHHLHPAPHFHQHFNEIHSPHNVNEGISPGPPRHSNEKLKMKPQLSPTMQNAHKFSQEKHQKADRSKSNRKIKIFSKGLK